MEKIKCVVWDLDNTVWDGTLLEDNEVKQKPFIREIITELDNRGILNSIASKNDYEKAMEKLKSFDLDEYFLFPHVNWGAKSFSIKSISELLNLNLKSFAFIDDQEYERLEVQHQYPEVLCVSSDKIDKILDLDAFTPRFITKDTSNRRKMYMENIERTKLEESFNGPKDEFLKSLNMILTISPVTEKDLKRVEELTVRTNQLNTTGYTYSYDELLKLSKSKDYKLFIAELEDRFGSYGKIGITLIHVLEKEWYIKLFLLSCRVMSRGVGTVFLDFIIDSALENDAKLFAEFKLNNVNKAMYTTYRFHGFKDIRTQDDGVSILEYNPCTKRKKQNYLKLVIK